MRTHHTSNMHRPLRHHHRAILSVPCALTYQSMYTSPTSLFATRPPQTFTTTPLYSRECTADQYRNHGHKLASIPTTLSGVTLRAVTAYLASPMSSWFPLNVCITQNVPMIPSSRFHHGAHYFRACYHVSSHVTSAMSSATGPSTTVLRSVCNQCIVV